MRLTAPAKINLTLEVTGVEANGYHTLDTLFAWLELHDSLTIEKASETTLEMEADGVDTSLVTADENNLVLKALRALEAHAGRALPTRFRLTKRIPAGGGLGGGSADAAAALVGLPRLHGVEVSSEQLQAMAARLGADVAFGLRGGFARGTRYGDVLEQLALPSELGQATLVLLAPGFPCPTPIVYGAWDQTPSRVAQGASERFLGAPSGSRLAEIRNDLQAPAESLFPLLTELRAEMEGCGLQAVTLSGSGSTLFGFWTGEGSLEGIVERLSGRGKVMVTRLRAEERDELDV